MGCGASKASNVQDGDGEMPETGTVPGPLVDVGRVDSAKALRHEGGGSAVNTSGGGGDETNLGCNPPAHTKRQAEKAPVAPAVGSNEAALGVSEGPGSDPSDEDGGPQGQGPQDTLCAPRPESTVAISDEDGLTALVETVGTAALARGEADVEAPTPLESEAVEAYHKELLSFIKMQAGTSSTALAPQIQYEADGLTPVDPSKMGGWVDPLLAEDAFGGTKEMEDVEKDFAQALRGGLDDTGEPPPRPGGYLESQGCWIRTMNQQRTCYLYIQTYTQVQRSTRPEHAGPYPEDAADAAAAAAAEAAKVAARAKAAAEEAAFPSTTVVGLRATVSKTVAAGKVPLLLAQGSVYDDVLTELCCWDGRAADQAAWHVSYQQLLAAQEQKRDAYTKQCTAKQQQDVVEWTEATAARKEERQEADGDDYEDSDEECPDFDFPSFTPEWDGTYQLDTAPFVLPFRRTKIKFDDHIEVCRQKLRRCMAAGGTAIVDLKGLAPDFIDKIGAKKYKGAFPPTLFDPTKNLASAKNGIFVRAKGDNAPTVATGFQLVVVAQQDPKRYTKELRGCFDVYWGNLQACRVVAS